MKMKIIYGKIRIKNIWQLFFSYENLKIHCNNWIAKNLWIWFDTKSKKIDFQFFFVNLYKFIKQKIAESDKVNKNC